MSCYRAHWALLIVLAALKSTALAASASSKYACEFDNRLCQWSARYMFGATVVGDKAFFNGGIFSNDASVPVNSSTFEVLDLETMSPYVIHVQNNARLSVMRYRHQLLTWRGNILAVGGQQKDSNGASKTIIDVVMLDLNTRDWSLLKRFSQPAAAPGAPVDVIIEASLVARNALSVVFQIVGAKTLTRGVLVMDLTNGEVNNNFYLTNHVVDVLDYSMVSILPSNARELYPLLVLTTSRGIVEASDTSMVWYEVTNVGEYGVEGPFSTTVSAGGLKKLPGSSNRQPWQVALMNILGQPKLITWAPANATFAALGTKRVNTISVYGVSIQSAVRQRRVHLHLDNVLVTLPSGVSSLSDLQELDMPLIGRVQALALDVIAVPYIGEVYNLDGGNVNMQPLSTGDNNRGFLVRGSARADYGCHPAATWQPFVVTVRYKPFEVTAEPTVNVLSKHTWRMMQTNKLAAVEVVESGASLESHTKLHRIASAEGPQLMVINAQQDTNPGGQLTFAATSKPLMGAFINLGRGSVQMFEVAPPEAYKYPTEVGSCTTIVGGQQHYLEHAGRYYEDRELAHAKFFSVVLQPGTTKHNMIMLRGGFGMPATMRAAMACSPKGHVYVFGGMVPHVHFDRPLDESVISETAWNTTNALYFTQIRGNSSGLMLSKAVELALTDGLEAPGPRSGHAMVYLPPSLVSQLSIKSSALVLFGGSDLNTTSLSDDVLNARAAHDVLNASQWDTSTWLYDIAADKWRNLPTTGEQPPGLMFHSITVEGHQVMLYGGLSRNLANRKIQPSTDLYILDFAEVTLRWRRATVDNMLVQGAFQLDFPNTGIAALPEFGVVAVMNRQTISLTTIPRSLKLSTAKVPSLGLESIIWTAGDWIRVEAPSDKITVTHPLSLAVDAIITGVRSTGTDMVAAAQLNGGHSAMSNLLHLQCNTSGSAAIRIWSSGAVLENVMISGCNGTAIVIEAGGTTADSDTSDVVLRNVHITGGTGGQGVAVHIGARSHVRMEHCNITANDATDSVVYAAAESRLVIVNSTFAANNGSGVAFYGSILTISKSDFHQNAAGNGGAVRIACEASTGAMPSSTSCNSICNIEYASFVGNQAESRGGAVFMKGGHGMVVKGTRFTSNNAGRNGGALSVTGTTHVQLHNTIFSSNMAVDDGGAMHLGLLSGEANLTQVVFTNNNCFGRGGALSASAMDSTLHLLNNTLDGNNALRGGALSLSSESSWLNVVGSMFTSNKAAPATGTTRDGQPTTSGSRVGGDGGAIFLGLGSLTASVNNTTLRNNTATGRGGAVSSIALSSNITLQNVVASGNVAGGLLAAAQLRSLASSQRLTLQNEGGAVHIGGGTATLLLLNTTLELNEAAKGGAVSVSSEYGRVQIDNSFFYKNRALAAGGGLSVTNQKSVSISNTTFSNNQLVLPWLGVGGAFYCFRCTQVVVENATFGGNIASYGGGAAVLHTTKPSSITSTLFLLNKALPNSQVARTLMAPAVVSSEAAGWLQEQQQGVHLRNNAVNPLLGEAGYYSGGAGLYLAAIAQFNLTDCGFVQNQGSSGGGVLANTDACKHSSKCGLMFTNTSILPDNNATGGGSGLFVTNIKPSIVRLGKCSSGSALNLNTSRTCLQKKNILTARVPQGSTRRLLASSASDDNYLVTSAARVECVKLLNVTNSVTEAAELCSDPLYVAPGSPITPAFYLVDGLGRNVTPGSRDAQMLWQARLLYSANGSVAEFMLEGDTTRAANGRAVFTGLRVNAKPEGNYTLNFMTESGLAVNRTVQLRGCWAGEYTLTESIGDKQAMMCGQCKAPQYSFFPSANSCGQCLKLLMNGYAVCNGPAVVPANGVYQSHPRSPLLHRCINPSACHRSGDTQQAMADWAYRHANYTIAQLNTLNSLSLHETQYMGYMSLMCSQGYKGPLCGACQINFGRSGSTCVQCPSEAANAFFFIGMCVFTFLIPVISMFMHISEVKRRTGKLRKWQQAQQAQSGSSAADAAADESGEVVAGAHGSNTAVVDAPCNIAHGATAVDHRHQQQQPQQHVSWLRQLQRRLLDVSVLDDELDTTSISSSSPATLPAYQDAPSEVPASCDAMASPHSQTSSPATGGADVPCSKLKRRSFKFWHTDVLMMMVSYMQVLGLLRLVRLNWSELLRRVLLTMDFTSSTSTWVSLECSFSSSSSLPRSVARSITLLLLPAAALAVLCIYWCCHAAVLSRRHSQAWQLPTAAAGATYRLKPVLSFLKPRAILSCVAMLHFLYTPTSREIVALFSCQPVDSEAAMLNQAPQHSSNRTEAVAALRNTNTWSYWPGRGVWTSDTDVVCGSAVHVGMVAGLGAPGLLLFVLGLPVLLWLVLRRYNRVVDGQHMMEDEQVELQFGLVYDKYRRRCYYYECVVLLEKCVLTMLLVLLQSQPAALQVLVAMVVVFIETVVHITLQPYACRMLDSLRRLSVFSLMTTLFLLMLISLSSLDEQTIVNIAAMIAIAIINFAVLAAHVWACVREVRRWARVSWDKDSKGYVTWHDAMEGIGAAVAGIYSDSRFGKVLAAKLRELSGVQQLQRQQQQGNSGAPRQECVVGSMFTVHPSGQQEARDGRVVVVNPTPPQQQVVVGPVETGQSQTEDASFGGWSAAHMQ